MKIIHVCLTGAMTDGFSYQENLLAKYHKKLGYDVTIISSKWIFDEEGEICRTDKTDYYNEDGAFVIRLDNRPSNTYKSKFKSFYGLTEAIEKENPDIFFIHGVQFFEIKEIAKYAKKHPNVRIYADNHADFSNSGRNFLSKNILQKKCWRHTAHVILPYTRKFYGVLPARVDWLKDMYKLPADKCELLVMGADDEAVEAAYSSNVVRDLKEKFHIAENDFVIVTGGKIDSFKLQTLLLMEAVREIEGNIKLIVFGSIQKDIQDKFNALCDGDKIQYAGWVTGNHSYEYFALADLVVFPGRHSIYWEQVAGMGIPMLCKYWDGTDHVDIGGNVIFLKEDSAKEIRTNIERLLNNKDEYELMLQKAQGKGKKQFSYSEIAKRAIELP